MKKKWLFFGTLVLLCAVGAILLWSKPDRAEQRTRQILQSLGEAELTQDESAGDTQIWHSGKTGTTYTFDGLGRLISAKNTQRTAEAAISRTVLREQAMQLAQTVLADARMGELVCCSEDAMYDGVEYLFLDVYDGVPAETFVTVVLRGNGQLFLVEVLYGTVFTRGEDGTVARTGESTMISREKAIQIAWDLLEPYAEKRDALPLELGNCKLQLFRGALRYVIDLFGPHDSHGHSCEFGTNVDAYTGKTDGIRTCK